MRVQCECGYTVEGLTADQADRFAAQHEDDECEPEILEEDDFALRLARRGIESMKAEMANHEAQQRASVEEILGADPDWIGGMEVDEYLDQQRRRW